MPGSDETSPAAPPARTVTDAPLPAPPPPPASESGSGLDFGAIAPAAPAAKVMAYSVDDANQLVRFAVEDPSSVTTTAIAGLGAGEHLVGLTRSGVGKLFALGGASRIYEIDPATAQATPVTQTTFAPALQGQAWAIAAGATELRVTTDVDQNLRIDQATGAVTTVDATLAFAAGDVNEGSSPAIASTTFDGATLYGIDAENDLVVRLASPTDGKVSTVGSLGLVVSDDAIGFAMHDGHAYAIIRVLADNGLYQIDLATGKATLVKKIDDLHPLRGLAIE